MKSLFQAAWRSATEPEILVVAGVYGLMRTLAMARGEVSTLQVSQLFAQLFFGAFPQ